MGKISDKMLRVTAEGVSEFFEIPYHGSSSLNEGIYFRYLKPGLIKDFGRNLFTSPL
jgi:hypothetical protein